jgi:hypothetical protein
MFRAVALTLRAGLHSPPLIDLMAAPFALCFALSRSRFASGLHSPPLMT